MISICPAQNFGKGLYIVDAPAKLPWDEVLKELNVGPFETSWDLVRELGAATWETVENKKTKEKLEVVKSRHWLVRFNGSFPIMNK